MNAPMSRYAKKEGLVECKGVKILVDVENGHKTGFYLVQRDNRRIAARYCKDKRVLNCFSYTGTFGVYALKGGASEVVNVDMSESALALAAQNVTLNKLDLSRAKFEQADVFKLLLLNAGGILLTFSYSGLMTQDLFQKVVADAQILERLNQSADHPIGTAYPEGHYLKGLVVKAW